MLYFLTTQPLWVSGTIIVGLTTVLAMLGPFFVRRHVSLGRLTANNEIAGFVFATVGVLYAVLLAFAIVVVWEKFSNAETIVAREAGAAESVFRLSQGIDDHGGAKLREALASYLAVTIDVDWPAMDRGNFGNTTRLARHALDALYASLLEIEDVQPVKTALMSEVVHQLDVMAQARRERLIASEGTVPSVIWLLLFGGAVLTISFTFFFGMESLVAQTLMTGLLSVLVFSELLAIIAIDRPFSGIVKLQPHSLANVLALYRSTPGPQAPGNQH